MDGLRNQFNTKGEKVAKPEDYLGAQLSNMDANYGTGRQFWSISSEKYYLAEILNVRDQINRDSKRLPSKCGTPMVSGYAAEMDVTFELRATGVQYYQELIGVLRWLCEIGCVDILLETSLLSTYLD